MSRSRNVADTQDNNGGAVSPFLAGKNKLINGAFDFWQRGTSFTANGYTADRWYAAVTGTTTIAQETTVIPDDSRYALKWTTGASASFATMYQGLEYSDVKALWGKTITFSLFVRAQASYSGNASLRIQTGTVADSLLTGTWTNVATTVFTPSTSDYVRVSVSCTVPTSTNGIRVALGVGSSQASGTGLYLAKAQLEVGDVVTPFTTATGTLAGELAACQRYYEKTYSIATAPGTDTYEGHQIISGSSDGGSQVYHTPRFQVRKRANPTMTAYTNDGISGQWGYNRSGASGNITASIIRISDNGALIYGNVGASYVVTTWAGHWVANAEL